jgi:hypothetical protein
LRSRVEVEVEIRIRVEVEVGANTLCAMIHHRSLLATPLHPNFKHCTAFHYTVLQHLHHCALLSTFINLGTILLWGLLNVSSLITMRDGDPAQYSAL